ncbi:MAG TPA: C39 family peptidase, partial [bacterium]|nr:C39 family peptidase [bacterium]
NQSPIGDKESELTKVLDAESKLGFGPSITLEQLKLVSESGLGMKSGLIVQLESIDQIKKELANNRPVIIPAAGKMLKNPNFRNGGPIYHMLVIIGYEGNEFITNDPGTRKGEGYRYDQNVIFDAVHDWDPANINNGQKIYLVYE